MKTTRDEHSQAILNVDAEALNKYKRERSYYRKVDQMQKDINEIKKCISSMCQRMEKIESR